MTYFIREWDVTVLSFVWARLLCCNMTVLSSSSLWTACWRSMCKHLNFCIQTMMLCTFTSLSLLCLILSPPLCLFVSIFSLSPTFISFFRSFSPSLSPPLSICWALSSHSLPNYHSFPDVHLFFRFIWCFSPSNHLPFFSFSDTHSKQTL